MGGRARPEKDSLARERLGSPFGCEAFQLALDFAEDLESRSIGAMRHVREGESMVSVTNEKDWEDRGK